MALHQEWLLSSWWNAFVLQHVPRTTLFKTTDSPQPQCSLRMAQARTHLCHVSRGLFPSITNWMSVELPTTTREHTTVLRRRPCPRWATESLQSCVQLSEHSRDRNFLCFWPTRLDGLYSRANGFKWHSVSLLPSLAAWPCPETRYLGSILVLDQPRRVELLFNMTGLVGVYGLLLRTSVVSPRLFPSPHDGAGGCHAGRRLVSLRSL
ncbi:hypothetical protein GE09DRAFT_614622 [Coniochaeta sp. 2T2.1]|nr:hypothetical protein GE09DRAFT_614622 [Coniochaeta sp. 2T2.1]